MLLEICNTSWVLLNPCWSIRSRVDRKFFKNVKKKTDFFCFFQDEVSLLSRPLHEILASFHLLLMDMRWPSLPFLLVDTICLLFLPLFLSKCILMFTEIEHGQIPKTLGYFFYSYIYMHSHTYGLIGGKQVSVKMMLLRFTWHLPPHYLYVCYLWYWVLFSPKYIKF